MSAEAAFARVPAAPGSCGGSIRSGHSHSRSMSGPTARSSRAARGCWKRSPRAASPAEAARRFRPQSRSAAVAAQRGRPIVVVNGVEAEPTSAKDRLLLRRLPHLVLDGAFALAAALGLER